jgi:Ca-activated chloride channel family protein
MRRRLACTATSIGAASAVLMSLGAPAPVPAQASSGVDGEPTAESCAAVGVRLERGAYEDGGAMLSKARPSRAMAMASPPPPPPPMTPPPPPPSPADMASSASLSEITVTAQRRTENIQNVPVAVTALSGGVVAQAAPEPPDTERYPNATPNPIKQVASDPVSTFSIDVDTASYSNVRRFLNDGATPPRDAVRVEEMINYFDYRYPKPASAKEPFRPFVAVTPSPWSHDRQIVHIGLQGYDLARTERPPLNLVFLLDTSGSMDEPDRLPLAIKALNVLIGQLRPRDHVAIVAYAGSAGEVLAPTDGSQKLKMRCALQTLSAGGSTAGGAGLALAYKLAKANFAKDGVNRIVLMTDGDFNVGVSDPGRLKDYVAGQRASGVYLSVYGYGRDNYNDETMQAIAQNGNGTAAYVDSLSEARRLFSRDFAATAFPIAGDVKIQVEFNPAAVSEYRLIGYETRMLNREDFNNDKVDAGEVGSGASVTALYEITPAGAQASSDPLRYGRAAPSPSKGTELAYLKVRYKLPGETTSRLIERPIGAGDQSASVDRAPEQTRWALAVAGYGQKLRGDPWLDAAFGWDAVRGLAAGARGMGDDGRRAEFLELVDMAGGTAVAAQ